MNNITNPIITIAGVWKPIDAKYITTDYPGYITSPFVADFILPDGSIGILYGAWAYNWKENQKLIKTLTPVNIALISVSSQNIATDVTSKYLADNTTNGVGSIQVADFNKDGLNDIFLSPNNEAPFVSSSTIAYLSNGNSYQKLILDDKVMSHDTALIYIDATPFIISATFHDDRPIKNQLIYSFDSKTNNFLITSPANSLRFGYMSVLGEDFDNDGNIEFIFSDTTWTGSITRFSDKMRIVTYEWINNDFALEPTQVIIPFLEVAKDFQGISSLWGVNNTHVPRLWAEDFNHDGFLDVIALNSLFGSDSYPVALQMLQNQKRFFFEDKTNILSSNIPNYTDELDYELSFKSIDSSGINYIFSGKDSATYDRQSNYIIGNDGTGKLYVIFHDEFKSLNSYLYSSAIEIIKASSYSQSIMESHFGNFHAIINKNNEINFMGMIPSYQNVGTKTQVNYSIFYIETQINPSTYFKENIDIIDRNQSLKIRTWAGNDSFLDTNNNSSLVNSTVIDGGLGIDKSIYSGNFKDYEITWMNSSTSIKSSKLNTNTKVNDKLINIERLKFTDKSLALDLNGNAGTTAKILGAVFGKDSISNKNYVGIGLHFLDAGWSYDNLAGLALDAAGAKTNDQIVSLLWTNVIGTKPTAADKQPFISLLENGMSAGALAHLAADTSFNTTNINLVGLAQTGIEYIPVS